LAKLRTFFIGLCHMISYVLLHIWLKSPSVELYNE